MLSARVTKLEAKRLRKAAGDIRIVAPLCVIAAIEEAKKSGTFPQSLCDYHLKVVVSEVCKARGAL